jgi:predicted metal-dependent phosphotriesterase family hydrolase
MTVTGATPFDQLGICDAHNHVWIDGFKETDPVNPVLDQPDLIQRELLDYKLAGGGTILDCQPGGCGRDGRRLRDLSRASGVRIIACTGFHRRKYYPADSTFWSLSSQSAADLFINELNLGLEETRTDTQPVQAGFMKVALEENWDSCNLAFLDAAAAAASETGCVVEIHTEKGALAEEIVTFFEKKGVSASQLVICHIDKRPDFGLHAELARAGVMLEYDTFFRPKYEPEARLWPLIDRMVAAGLGNRVALATDMAEKEMYHAIGGGPGLSSLPGKIKSRLSERGLPENIINQLTGENITRRLARLN